MCDSSGAAENLPTGSFVKEREKSTHELLKIYKHKCYKQLQPFKKWHCSVCIDEINHESAPSLCVNLSGAGFFSWGRGGSNPFARREIIPQLLGAKLHESTCCDIKHSAKTESCSLAKTLKVKWGFCTLTSTVSIFNTKLLRVKLNVSNPTGQWKDTASGGVSSVAALQEHNVKVKQKHLLKHLWEICP